MNTTNTWHKDSPFRAWREHPNWGIKHPLGPVTFDLKCLWCDTIIAEDINIRNENVIRDQHREVCTYEAYKTNTNK